jgi:glutamyl-Q tRNA(Asp) synthetase
MHESETRYCGRFAPSPTGPLHFGSLVAAVGSYLDARSRLGRWLVRIEDLDPPREVPGAADAILRALEAYGFEWDNEVLFQKGRAPVYRAALANLERMGATYPCACSRKEVSDSSLSPSGERIYPGTCRGGLPIGRKGRSTRVRVGDAAIGFDDALMGRVEQRLSSQVGDFIVKRADGACAYQLAVVVDDFEQGVTDVVRGADLLACTPRQLYLQRLLALPPPRYAHLPVVVDSKGEKLSKQTHAIPLPMPAEPRLLWRALRFLGQDPPHALAETRIAEVWRWALPNWSRFGIPRQLAMAEPDCR